MLVPTTELPHQSIMHPASLLACKWPSSSTNSHCCQLSTSKDYHSNFQLNNRRGLGCPLGCCWKQNWCLTAWWLIRWPAPNPKGSALDHTNPTSTLRGRITGSNFHHSTAPAGHLMRKLERKESGVGTNLWESHDRTGRSPDGLRPAGSGSGGLRKRCKLPSHWGSSQARHLTNIGPKLLPTDILCLCLWCNFTLGYFESHNNLLSENVGLIVAKHIWLTICFVRWRYL